MEVAADTVKEYFPSCKSLYVKSCLQGFLTDCGVHVSVMFVSAYQLRRFF